MKYFRIRQPSDKKIIGITDGLIQAEIIESKWKNKKELKRYTDEYILGVYNTLNRLEKSEKIEPPAFEYIKVKPKAILTDFLTFSESYAGGEYLITEKTRLLLLKFNVHCRIYTNVPLFKLEKRVEGYSNLHLIPLKSKQVFNFKNSIFFNGSKNLGKILRYANTYEDYLALHKEGKIVYYELLSLYETIIKDLDILSFDTLGFIYVSERLKIAIEAEALTGIEFLDLDEPRLSFV